MEPVESDRHSKAADAVHDGRPVASRFVRSGGKGASIVPILLISTLGAAVVLFLIYLFWLGPLGKAESTGNESNLQDTTVSEQVPAAPNQPE